MMLISKIVLYIYINSKSEVEGCDCGGDLKGFRVIKTGDGAVLYQRWDSKEKSKRVITAFQKKKKESDYRQPCVHYVSCS